MGVRSCSRNKCTNIMCDTYIPNVGYICDECKHEFMLENIREYKEYEIEEMLTSFLVNSKKQSNTNLMTVEEYFKQNG